MEEPRFKTEIRESGLTQKEWYRTIYLRSAHWRQLKLKKLREVGRCCEVKGENCTLVMPLDIHHLNYRNIYDVKLSDLQVVCRNCHNLLHEDSSPPKKVSAPKKTRKAKIKSSRIDERGSPREVTIIRLVNHFLFAADDSLQVAERHYREIKNAYSSACANFFINVLKKRSRKYGMDKEYQQALHAIKTASKTKR